jgi:two-component system LytT family sensor kinase
MGRRIFGVIMQFALPSILKRMRHLRSHPYWKNLRFILIIFASWTAFGAMDFTLTYSRHTGPQPLYTQFLLELFFWSSLAIGTPFVFWFADRFPVERPRRVVHLSIHILLSLIYLAANCGFRLLYDHLDPAHPFGTTAEMSLQDQFQLIFLRSATVVFFDYWGILGIGHAVRYYRKFREREKEAADLTVKASQLEAQLARAELQALRMQLNPHFLFNTLHSIGGLIRENNQQAAIRMISGLGDLLRQTLDNIGVQEVTLKEELDFIQKYLEIEQIRFQDRLKIQVEIAPETYFAQVPYLILQPLVENAIRHGISNRIKASTVELRSWRDGEWLFLQVRDDGPGLAQDWESRDSIGITNTRGRLHAMFKELQEFSICNAEPAGTVAKISIPFRSSESAKELAS